MTDENPPAEPQEPDEPPTPDDEPNEPDNEPEGDNFDAAKAAEKIRKINSENRNLRKRAQEAEDKAKDIDGKDNTISTQAAEILRLRIAVKHGLPEQLVKRLTGTTEEEILQDAEELMELFGSKAPPSRSPKEKLRSPSDPAGDAEVDIDKVVQRAFEH